MSSDKFLPPQAGVSLDTEMYNRVNGGQFSKRVGFLRDFLSSVTVVNIQNTIATIDMSRLSQEIANLPLEINKRQLMATYKSITDTFRNIQDYNDESGYQRLFTYCEQSSSSFLVCIDEQLLSIGLETYEERKSLDRKLGELEDICLAYAVTLSIYLYSALKLYQEKVGTEQVISNQIKNAYFSLRNKLRETLTPGNSVKNSLLLDAFVDEGDDRLDIYVEYDGRYLGAQGARKIVQLANSEYTYREQIVIDKPRLGVNPKERILADKLIELMRTFEAVYEARQSCNFEANSELVTR